MVHLPKQEIIEALIRNPAASPGTIVQLRLAKQRSSPLGGRVLAALRDTLLIFFFLA